MACMLIEPQIRSATLCVDAGSEFLCSVEDFCTIMTRCVDNAIDKIDEIKHLKVNLANEVQPCFQAFRIAVEEAKNFVEKIDDFTFYCSREDRMMKVKIAVESGNFEPLEQLLAQLQQTLEQARQFHGQFQQDFQRSSSYSRAAANSCKDKAITARSKKIATRAIGGTFAAGTLAGGITVSVIAGVFTFGIGTIVGLSVTAAVLVGGGLLSSTVTGIVAQNFNTAENSLRALSEIFDYLVDGSFKLDDQVQQLQTIIKNIMTVVHDVDVNRREYSIESVSASLELLHTKNAGAHNTTSHCRAAMTALEQRVRNKFTPTTMRQCGNSVLHE